MEAAIDRIEFGTLAFDSAARGLNRRTFPMKINLPILD
jgi:hypothetical protein